MIFRGNKMKKIKLFLFILSIVLGIFPLIFLVKEKISEKYYC